MTPKPIRAWCCTWNMTSCEPYWMLETIADSSKASKALFLAGRGARAGTPWNDFYADGARCVRITIRGVEK